MKMAHCERRPDRESGKQPGRKWLFDNQAAGRKSIEARQ
jgi:hypothetical protein